MIQWYPGHMAKSIRILKKDLKLVDLVVETLDARVPMSSRNPDLDELLVGKERVIVLNKIDLADRGITGKWLDYFGRKYPAVGINSLTGKGIGRLIELFRKTGEEINSTLREKGRQERAVRVMIIGIPNVGKSALINALAGSSLTRTGNRPGVTRGRQWIKVGREVQLLDTPGILWPRFDDQEVGYKLALTGAIRDIIFDQEQAAYKLIDYLREIDLAVLGKGYGINPEEMEGEISYDILPLIGRKRGCLISGGRVDRTRAAEVLLNDFRKGKLGPISLEIPEREEE